ncbi:MAG TPA: sigma-70 family RNA polymerase sigma factor [Solirubrobacteraceae bacterium]|jgi:RNA polymerase sigma-70 factor (ECF subfamily)|nr:sigma-70 family RNA polymerase sigma factor [Solirubrobacteraceae bacterium]
MDEVTLHAHAARLGDEHALEALVRAGYRDVWRLCAALVDRQSADDLAQETFVRATRALPGFRGHASARTWMLAIARNTCVDELRARSRRRRREQLLAATVASQPTAPDASDEVTVNDLLSLLDIDRRTAFVLTQIFRLSYEQAAHVCDCPVGTIRSRVARARKELIAALDAGQAGGQARQRAPGAPHSSAANGA